jgi:hypothetical protein
MTHVAEPPCVSELGRYFAVDETGYVLISTAADCRIASHRVTVGATRVALPTAPMPGRKRLYVKNNEPFENPSGREGHPLLYVGGPDVTADILAPASFGNGFVIPAGDELVLDLSDKLVLYAVCSPTESVDTSILELA